MQNKQNNIQNIKQYEQNLRGRADLSTDQIYSHTKNLQRII